MSWLRSLRSSASDRDRILAGAASIAITIALAKVFSPQYLLWLVPLVVAIPGKKRIPIALLVGACALTAWVFPNHWLALLSLHWTPLIVELLREVLVLTSAGFLAAAVRPLRAPEGRRSVARLDIDNITPQDFAAMTVALHEVGPKPTAMVFDQSGVSPHPARNWVTVRLPRDLPSTYSRCMLCCRRGSGFRDRRELDYRGILE